MIGWKGSQNSEKLLYPWLCFITVKGYRLKLTKRKGAWCEVQEEAGTSFQASPYRGLAQQLHGSTQEYCQSGEFTWASVSRLLLRAISHVGLQPPQNWHPYLYSRHLPEVKRNTDSVAQGLRLTKTLIRHNILGVQRSSPRSQVPILKTAFIRTVRGLRNLGQPSKPFLAY